MIGFISLVQYFRSLLEVKLSHLHYIIISDGHRNSFHVAIIIHLLLSRKRISLRFFGVCEWYSVFSDPQVTHVHLLG